jgi:streptogramin lyase
LELSWVRWVCNPADRRWTEQRVIGAALLLEGSLLLEESAARRPLLTVRTSVRRGPGQPLGGSFEAASIGLWLRARRAFAAPLLVLGVLLGAPTAGASSTPTESASATAASGVGEGWNGFGGGSLPGPEWRPYASTSPWNTSTAGAEVVANSAAYVSQSLSYGPGVGGLLSGSESNDWAHPTYWAQPGDPITELQGPGEIGGARIPVPSYARPAGGGDKHMGIVTPDGWEYDMWEASAPSNGVVTFQVGGKTRIDGSGLGPDATAAGFANLAGIIRGPELIAGKINHALFIVLKCVSAEGDTSFGYGTTSNGTGSAYVYPASHGASSCPSGTPNTLPVGARFKLEMSDSEIAALSVPGWKKTILTALAHYGGYVGDTGGPGFGFEFESGASYTALGLPDPLVTFAALNNLPTWNGANVFEMASGVDWAKYLRVIAPPPTSPPPESEPSPKINRFDPRLTETRFPDNIAIGADGNLWVTGHERASIDRITPGGAASEFFLAPGSTPDGIVAGPDGNLWFSEFAGRIGRITPAGVLQEFSNGISGHPTGITTGPDGNLWFPETDGKIGRITTEGAVTEFSTGITARYFDGITAGPDGNLWVMESGGMIGRITTAGVVTEFSTDLGGPSDGPLAIARGPDGNIWFAESGRIGRITTEGVVTRLSAPQGNAAVYSLASGPDGNLWFAESDGAIGRITTGGDVTTFHENVGGNPLAITPGREGDLWFIEESGQVGRVLP